MTKIQEKYILIFVIEVKIDFIFVEKYTLIILNRIN